MDARRPAPGLGDHECGFVRIAFAAFQRFDHLADDQQRRIADVVVHVFQALVDDLLAGVLEDFHMIAIVIEDLGDHAEMDGEHHRHIDGMGLSPFLG